MRKSFELRPYHSTSADSSFFFKTRKDDAFGKSEYLIGGKEADLRF